jgi:hypothetical protein
VFAIAYATKALSLAKVPVLIPVTAAALLMGTLLPVSGLLVDRFGAKRVYASGIAAFAITTRGGVRHHRPGGHPVAETDSATGHLAELSR